MFRSIEKARGAIVAIALVAATGPSTLHAQGAPIILSTHANVDTWQVLISGYNFGPSPKVL